MVLAFFADTIEGNITNIAQYTDLLEPQKTHPFSLLVRYIKDSEEEDSVLVGRLREIPEDNNVVDPKFVNPKEAVSDNAYLVSNLFISPCADGSCTSSWGVSLMVYKTPSEGWRIRRMASAPVYYGLWTQSAFDRELKKANNEPFNFRGSR